MCMSSFREPILAPLSYRTTAVSPVFRPQIAFDDILKAWRGRGFTSASLAPHQGQVWFKYSTIIVYRRKEESGHVTTMIRRMCGSMR